MTEAVVVKELLLLLLIYVALELHNGLLATVWETSRRMIRRHAITILILCGGDGTPASVAQRPAREVEHFTVEQFNEDQYRTPSVPTQTDPSGHPPAH